MVQWWFGSSNSVSCHMCNTTAISSSAISHPNRLLPQPRVLSESLGSCFSHLLTPGLSLTVWLVSHWSLDLCALLPDYVCFDFASTGQRTRLPLWHKSRVAGCRPWDTSLCPVLGIYQPSFLCNVALWPTEIKVKFHWSVLLSVTFGSKKQLWPLPSHKLNSTVIGSSLPIA